MSSDSIGPLCLTVFIIAVVADALDGGHRPAPQPVSVPANSQVTSTWNERSDCYPGAPPNSLANAVDPLHAHCDRAAAIARIAPLALMAAVPVLGEATIAEGAAEGAAASEPATGTMAASDLRVAGAVADAAAAREASAEGATTEPVPRTYRVTSTGRDEFQAEPTDAAANDPGVYQVQRVGRGSYEVTSSATGRSYPTSVRRVGEDDYEVQASDGTRSRVTSRQLERWYANGSPTEETWQYEKR